MCVHACALAYARRTHARTPANTPTRTHEYTHTQTRTHARRPPLRTAPPPGMPSLARGPPAAGPGRGDVDSPLFLNPRGAKTLRTPRMRERESKSQRGARPSPRMPLDVLVPTDKVCPLPLLCTRRVRRTTGVQVLARAGRPRCGRVTGGCVTGRGRCRRRQQGHTWGILPGMSWALVAEPLVLTWSPERGRAVG